MKVGNVLCDMHDGFQYLDKTLRVLHHVRIHRDDAHDVLQGILDATKISHPYTNKMLVVVGENVFSGTLVAMYSYDNRELGIIELKETP